MKILKSLLFLGLISLTLCGCWVAMPSNGPPGAEEHVGSSYMLQRDILIVSYYWVTPISWEISKKEQIGVNQKILMTLKTGNKIKIVSIKHFRLDSGIHYAYRCIDVKSDKKFDLGFSMLDCIGLPKY